MAVANEALASRYTDENYVTRQGFFAALGSSLVSDLWNGVEQYRLVHSEPLGLKTITGLPFRLTKTAALKRRYEEFLSKLLELKKAYDAFPSDGEDKETAFRQASYECLKRAAELEKVRISEPSLKAMANLIYRDAQPGHEAVLAYRDFMRGQLGAQFGDTDTYLGQVYAAMCGVEELVAFYRLDDPHTPYGSTSYAGFAPHEEIERLMEEFSFFVEDPDDDPLGKALLSLYFIVYVDPFVAHNSLMASLFAKKLLQDSVVGDVALLLPLEAVLIPTSRQREAFLEAQKKGDFTYVYLYAIEVMTPLVENLLNLFVSIRRDAYKKEYASIPKEQEPASVPPTMVETPSTSTLHQVEEVKEKPIAPALEEIEEEEPAPVLEEEIDDIYVEEDVPEEVSDKKKAFEAVPELETLPATSYSVFAPKASLSDKEVKMAARYLMETHPQLNRQQSLFFASHSTIGRYYTVQDYKKAMRVAYETARTSMDRLAACRLYKKYRIKNKYVYTPSKPGEKE